MPTVTTAQVDARAAKAGLPSNWRDLPTTDASEAVTVWAFTQEYGSAKGAGFKTWYDAARKKDPQITPNQAFGAYLTGATLSAGVGVAAGVTTGVPAAAAAGAENVYKTPLGGLAAIGAFFAALTQANTWVRILKVAVGGVLLIAGVIKMTGSDRIIGKLGPVGMAVSKVPGV